MHERELLQSNSFRDRVSTVTEQGKRKWVYALKPEGNYYNARSLLAYFYLAIFFILPFIHWNDLPFILINVIEGKFILFGKIFWPQDFFIFAIAMIIWIVIIILFTKIYGRLFCGWVCPQTIFMEFLFRPIEWLIEGSPTQQRKLNNNKSKLSYYRTKILKHFIFFLISFLIAHAFLSYIIGVQKIWAWMQLPLKENIGLIFGLLSFTVLFYSVFAFVREIVCTTICPYGRLQHVLVDKNTIQIAYDFLRGEPRSHLNKRENSTSVSGDCIDCKLCIQVCPTGIDIRNGTQMECVGCSACIDECDTVMRKIKKPLGLIRYASETEILAGKKISRRKTLMINSIFLSALMIIFIALIASRRNVDSYVTRAKGQLFTEVSNDTIANLYHIRVINKMNKSSRIQIKLLKKHGNIISIGSPVFNLEPESVNEKTFFVYLPKKELQIRSTKIQLGIFNSNNQIIQTISTNFLGPYQFTD